MKQQAQIAAAYFVLFCFFLNLISHFNRVDHDMLHELAWARECFSSGCVPRNDTFAFTETVTPVVHHEWGTGVLLYCIIVVAGLGATGLMAIKYAASFAAIWLTVRSARWQGGALAIVLLLCPIALILACFGFTTIRAQVFTLLFVAAQLLLFEYDRRGRRRWTVYWLLLYVIWLNMHAGFLVGAGLFGCHVIERVWVNYRLYRSIRTIWQTTWHLFAAGGAMCVLWLINPFFWHYGVYLAYAVALERPRIAEWERIWSSKATPVVIPLYITAILLVIYSVARRGLSRLPGILLISVTAVFAYLHIRHLPIFALVWLAQVPGYLSKTPIGRICVEFWKKHSTSTTVVPAALGIMFLIVPVNAQFWRPSLPVVGLDLRLAYPVGAVEYLDRHVFTGNLMVSFSHGSYVSWRLYPRVKVSIDSRYEVAYPPSWADRVWDLYDAKDGWEESLAAFPTDAILVGVDSPLAGSLTTLKRDQWKKVYEDESFCLFFRTELANQYPVEYRRRIPEGVFP